MKLEQSFEVPAPVDEVWALLIDVERVAPCLPGAEITEHDEDGTYRGSFQVKLGPTTAAYRGSLKLESVDEAAHVVTMRAEGTDKRGQGGAKATMVSTLREQDGTTTVDVVTDFTITGRLARFGRGGMIQDVSNRLLRDFAACLQTQVPSATASGAQDEPSATGPSAATPASVPSEDEPAPPSGAPPAAAPAASARPVPQSEPINGFQLVLSVLRDRLKRLFGRG